MKLSNRLAVMYEALAMAGFSGATSAELQRETGAMAVATDVADLRKRGIGVVCKYEGLSRQGRRVYRYWLARGAAKDEMANLG